MAQSAVKERARSDISNTVAKASNNKNQSRDLLYLLSSAVNFNCFKYIVMEITETENNSQYANDTVAMVSLHRLT